MSVQHILKKNGILHTLAPDQRPITLGHHGSGGLLLQVGSESVVLPPRLSIELAVAMLRGAGVNLVEVDNILATYPADAAPVR